MNCAGRRSRSSALVRHLGLRYVRKRTYRVAHKVLDAALLLFNIESEMDFASPYISYFVAVLILLIYVALGMAGLLVVAVRFQAESQFFSSPP